MSNENNDRLVSDFRSLLAKVMDVGEGHTITAVELYFAASEKGGAKFAIGAVIARHDGQFLFAKMYGNTKYIGRKINELTRDSIRSPGQFERFDICDRSTAMGNLARFAASTIKKPEYSRATDVAEELFDVGTAIPTMNAGAVVSNAAIPTVSAGATPADNGNGKGWGGDW